MARSRRASDWQRMAERLSRRLHIRRAVALLESSLVDVPTVIGWLKPVVLLPAERAGRPGAAAARSDSRPRTRAHPAPRLSREPAADARRDRAVLSPWPSGGYPAGSAWNARTAATISPSACAVIPSAMRVRSRIWRPGAARSRFALAANGGSLLERVRRLVGAPASHAGRGPAWLAGIAALTLVGGMAVAADASVMQQQTRPPVSRATAPAQGTSITSADMAQAVPVPPQPPAPPRTPGGSEAPPAPSASDVRRFPRPRGSGRACSSCGTAPPAVPASGEQSGSPSARTTGRSGNWSWSNNGEKLSSRLQRGTSS